MSPYGIGTGGRMSVFFGLASITNYPVARIVAGDQYGRTFLAFQTGLDQHLVERMRLDTNGYLGVGTSSPNYMLDVSGMTHISDNVFLNGQSILYKKYTIPTPRSGSLYLNYTNVGEESSTTIDIQLSLCNTVTPNNSTIAKFTAYLSGYQGINTGLYLNNITVQANGTPFFGPYNIKANTYDISGISIQIDYVNNPTSASVNYVAYGPGAYKITTIDITPLPLVGAPAVPTEPGPPINVVATAGPGQATVSWSAPASNGGSVITGYTVSWLGGSQLLSGTSTTITGLTNGTPYTFTVYASNTIGNSGVATSNSVTPVAPPGTPTNVVATGGNGQATLTWLAPASNGGSAIIDYFISYSGGTMTSSGTSTTITGLSNGSPYTFTVYARNSVGTSTGTTSNTVTPISIVYAFSNVTFPGATFTGTSYYTVDQTINMSWNINWTFPTVYYTEFGTSYTTIFSGNSAELNFPYSGYLITSIIIYARNASNNTLIATSQRFSIAFNYNF
jgi:hypothetical protein